VITMRIPNHIDPRDDEALAAWTASDQFDPDPAELQDATPLRRVAAAVEGVEQHLRHEVDLAHQAGLSWTVIAAALGVSRQAARQRFGSPAPV
jgi:DNA-directed RNA polymerase specialized sigma24 family protein